MSPAQMRQRLKTYVDTWMALPDSLLEGGYPAISVTLKDDEGDVIRFVVGVEKVEAYEPLSA